MKKVFLILMTLMLVFSLAYAETFRQGDDRLTFHHTTEVTKTAAYTITAADSLIKVTASSADIVITLPTISTLGGGSKSYKILKTDATAYSIVVTPATGQTIAGESTRYLTYQNAYMIISTSSGNRTDWKVNFESPYVVEDYAAGTVVNNAATTTINGRLNKLFVVDGTTITGGAKVLTLADCGMTISDQDATPATTWTLPANTGSGGCEFKFINNVDSADDDTITSATADTINCSIDVDDASYSVVAADVINFVDTADVVGDHVICESDGTTWLCRGVGEATGSITCSG